MSYLLNPLLSALLLYGYAALFIFEYVSAIIVPLPVTAMLLAAGAFASQGYFNFWAAFAIALPANTLGDLTGYGLTRKYGDSIVRVLRLHRLPFFEYLKEELRTDAAITVAMTRFAGSLSPVINMLAGLVGVSFATFLIFDVLGNLVEPAAALSLGYLAGSYWSNFSSTLDIVAAVIAVIIIMFILARMQRRIVKKLSSRDIRKSG